MRAYVLEEFDRPPVFADVPAPEPGDDEALVRVEATSVNPYDNLVASGVYRDRLEHRFPAVFGRDVAGVVEAVGASVTRLAVGDPVFGFVKRDYIGNGTFAELVAVRSDHFVTHRPRGLALDEAGALGLASVTALQCLDFLELRPGATVFVNGATGGVGSFAVQLARASGLRVVATGRPGAEEEHVRGLGADAVVDWSAGDVAAAVLDASPGGVDGMVDLVSTREGLAETAGRVVVRGGRATTTRHDDPPTVEGVTLTMIHSVPEIALLERVAGFLDRGELGVPITHRFAFDELPLAFEKLREGAIGKIAVAGAGAR
ncbi:MAG: NADP-dependent oxidoreductase [Gaiella sp.]|nr:NADP-dependent oxidoreductase [Gaiella sp.]